MFLLLPYGIHHQQVFFFLFLIQLVIVIIIIIIVINIIGYNIVVLYFATVNFANLIEYSIKQNHNIFEIFQVYCIKIDLSLKYLNFTLEIIGLKFYNRIPLIRKINFILL